MNTFRLTSIALALAMGTTSALAADASQDVQDARREAQIWTTYGFNPNLRAMDISVEVNGPTAVLTGVVESGVEKDLAEQIALSVEGVKKVDNQLKVDGAYTPGKNKNYERDRNYSTAVDDASTTAKVKSKLLWNTHTDGLQINVDTKNGVVVLKGVADTAAEKDLAERLAANTHGVVSVKNNLTVSGKGSGKDLDKKAKDKADFAAAEVKGGAKDVQDTVSDAWITSKVKSTLLYSRNVDGSDIDVETKGGVVRLKGKVDSSGEKDYAVELAKDIRGVKSVDASGLKS